MPTPEATHSGLVGQMLSIFLYVGSEWVMFVLLGLSVVSMGVAIERALFFRRRAAELSELHVELGGFLARDQPERARDYLKGKPAMAARVADAGLGHLGRGAEAADELMAAVLLRERADYERGLAFLGTLGNNAPFVGLFGTVLGIIRSFRDLATNTTQGASAVMAGIAEALVATAVGLLVALPAVALFNYFQRRIKSEVASADALTHLVLAHAKSQASSETKRPTLVSG